MPIAQHFQWFIKLFSKAADSDSDPEHIEREQDWYTDSQNMRSTSIDGHMGSISKIHGEVVKWANIDNRPVVEGCLPSGGTGLPLPLSYFCIGSIQVLNHIVEFWADELGVGVPYVRIDGWVVVYPTTLSDFPISTQYPPQLDKNDSCVGGEVFYTDDHIPPFILNVSDMLENAGVDPSTGKQDFVKYPPTAKYFCSFNIQDFQIQPPSQLDHPVFIEICPTGTSPNSIGQVVFKGTGGMKVGMYQYAFQYVDSSGNTTNWSELTPQIPMPLNIGYSEPIYPSTKVYGGEAGATNISINSIHIRFRVTNLFNYAGINIRRVTWDAGAPIGSPATDDSIIYSTPTGSLAAGEISIIDFYDNDNSTLSPIPQEETTNNLSSIQAAKSIRYFQSRLTLWNITYASKNLSNSSLHFDSTNNTMYPFVRPLGVQGYKDIWNDVYRKSYMRGEKYGFALVGFDNNGNASFAIPIPGNNPSFTQNQNPNPFDNFFMPQRRDVLSGPSLLASVEVYNSSLTLIPRTQCTNSLGGVSPTYEVFDQNDMVSKNVSGPADPVISILNATGILAPQEKWVGCDTLYSPFRPVQDADVSNNFTMNPTVAVNDGSINDTAIIALMKVASIWDGTAGRNTSLLEYNPRGFLPNLYALGMILQGVSNLPNWISSFAIVRTPPAGRIKAQGQGFYDMASVFGSAGWQTTPSGKNASYMCWDSPDMLTAIADQNIITSVASSRYKAQLVSAVGFFSEVYHGYSVESAYINELGSVPSLLIGGDRELDMISYCRILYDLNQTGQALFNPVSSGQLTMAGQVGGPGNAYLYTTFNSWRNSPNSISPNQEFVLSWLQHEDSSGYPATVGSAPRAQCFFLGVSGTVYAQQYTHGDYDYINGNVANFHEPCYVTNIVDDSLNVTNNLTQNYLQTGAYVKVSSIIGQYNGRQDTFYLVDERWQDCIPAENANDPTANQNRFIYIQDSNNNQFAWLNVTYMTSAQITTIKNDISSNGFYNATTCHGTVKVYGLYTHTISPYVNGNLTSQGNKLYGVVLNQGFVPDGGDYIIVKYDSCAPIEIFGGDTYIGEYNYPIADCLFTNNADYEHSEDLFYCDIPMPYREWEYNERIVTIADQSSGFINKATVQTNNLIRMSGPLLGNPYACQIRQYLVNGIVEARTNMSLFFNNPPPNQNNDYQNSFFPNVNYVIRPIKWANNVSDQHARIQSDYFDPNLGYGNSENLNWGYGGFRMNYSGSSNAYNYDYSSEPTANESFSIPSSGFVENLNFCSRCIWSDRRTTSEENNPNLKNFPTNNVYDFDDSTGGINKAWDSSNAGQQGNLYAFTNKGTVMAETNKSILSSISGGQLAEIGGGNDQFIQAEVWISRDKGMPDQMWRSAAEYSNSIYWADKSDMYKLKDNQIADLGQDFKYYKVLLPLLNNIKSGYGDDVTAVWNDKYQEYWLCVNPHRVIASSTQDLFVYDPISTPSGNYIVVNQDQTIDVQNNTINLRIYTINGSVVSEFYVINNNPTATLSVWYVPLSAYTLSPTQMYRLYYSPSDGFFRIDQNFQNLCNDVIWGEQVKGFVGQFKYRFDKYTTDNNGNIYGSRYGATYLLDTGYIMNGTSVQAWVLQSYNPKEGFQASKEFIRLRTSTNFIPDQILFFQTVELYQSGTPHSAVSGFPALKNYGSDAAPSFECYVPRGMNPPNHRNQGNYTLAQTFYAQETDWWVSSQAIQWKALK